MRPNHTAHSLPSFPVYSCAFLSAEKFVLGGGGGASRSGIKNTLRLYTVNGKREIELDDEFELDKGEDAPMSMAAHAEENTIICGVNSVQEKLDEGKNENCRVFSVQNDKIRLLSTKGTLVVSGADDYQKVTVLSDGGILAVAGSHDLSLLSFPLLSPIAESIHTENEIYDVSFTSSSLVIVTTHDLLIYSIPDPHIGTNTTNSGTKFSAKKRKKSKTSTLNGGTATLRSLVMERKVSVSITSTGDGSMFRAIKRHPLDDSIAYTAINTSAARSKKSKTPHRQSYIVKWNTKTWAVEKSRKVGDRGITCFDISADGRFLAFGSSDLSVSIFESRTMSPLMSILKAFEFPPTFVKFNPTTSLLISGSADNSIRILAIPKEVAGPSRRYLFSLLALMILLLAIAVAYYKFLEGKG